MHTEYVHTYVRRLTDDLPYHEDQGNDTGYDQLVPSLLGGLDFLGLLVTLTPKCTIVCMYMYVNYTFILDECRALWGELEPERSAILNLQVTCSATYV